MTCSKCGEPILMVTQVTSSHEFKPVCWKCERKDTWPRLARGQKA